MRLRHFLVRISITILLLASGCSYRFCDIGPVCRAQHIFLPQPLTIATVIPDERLAVRPLRATFSSANIDYVGIVLATELDTSDALTHQNGGLYVFEISSKTYTIKLKNIYLSFKPEFPPDHVPSPQRVHFCLSDINYSLTNTALTINGKPLTSDLSYSDICADVPASDLGAWIDCGDGCPPIATTP